VISAFTLILIFASAAILLFVPPLAQNTEYYNFADVRRLLGVPNFWNVISNLPFLLFGLWGLWLSDQRGVFQFEYEKWPYVVFFTGSVLTAFGSAYFHWRPGTSTLLWDRLPMALLFMGMTAGTLSDHLSPQIGRRWLAPLVMAGVGSVLWWFFTEQTGRGDLRPYAIVQFGPMLLLPAVMLLQRSRYRDARYVWLAAGLYLAAKVLEQADGRIFAAGGTVSGHTLKHLAAALATLAVIRMLGMRLAFRSQK